MPSRSVRTLARAINHAPGLKRIPVVKLLSAAELAVVARDHIQERLTPQERRRIFELLRIGRGRKRNLSAAEQDELSALVAKAEPRLLAGEAVDALSPVPLPHRLIYGRRRR